MAEPHSAAAAEQTRPFLICVTPVKNEAWILPRFLACTSLWADLIVVADQGSTDQSREIAARFPKVRLIQNDRPQFDEAYTHSLLVAAAREHPGPRIIFAFDADEVLSAQSFAHPEWQSLLQAPPGTVCSFRRVNLAPDLQYCWFEGARFPLAFVDDDTPYQTDRIHGPRIPFASTAPMLEFSEIVVLHYQFTEWQRMRSKHRWYQCWEQIHRGERGPVRIFRQYHHMDYIPPAQRQSVPASWLAPYEERGIDMTSTQVSQVYWWDREVAAWLDERGSAFFHRQDIWSSDWAALAAHLGLEASAERLRDPRGTVDKVIHRWLRYSQRYADTLPVRVADFALNRLWR